MGADLLLGDAVDAVLSGAATHHVACERAEAFIDRIPDGAVSLMTLDFPYFGVKDDAWDNAWPTPEAFIEWMSGVLAQCRRVLAPNGSIYMFAAPQVRGGLTMATRVECEVARHFSVLQRITWQKPEGSTKAEMNEKSGQRAFFPTSEAVIFAEQPGVSLLGRTIKEARISAGLSTNDLSARIGHTVKSDPSKGTGLVHLWESYPIGIGSCVPSEAEYIAAMQVCGVGPPPFASLVRPFSVSPDVPYTDVWTYETVNTYPGKHPCEKPPRMARDIVRASSREGGLVADFFCGSGAFLAAAVAEGRRAIGCDMDPHWAEQAQRRCDAVKATGRVVRTAPQRQARGQLDMFGGAAK
jgi:site-specific DNA-methyltransferase (adenine-specific)